MCTACRREYNQATEPNEDEEEEEEDAGGAAGGRSGGDLGAPAGGSGSGSPSGGAVVGGLAGIAARLMLASSSPLLARHHDSGHPKPLAARCVRACVRARSGGQKLTRWASS